MSEMTPTEFTGRWVAWTRRIMRRGGFNSTPARMVEALEMLCGKPGKDWGDQCPLCCAFTGNKWEVTMLGGKVRERLECPYCRSRGWESPKVRQPTWDDA